jgi:hypothetical protein
MCRPARLRRPRPARLAQALGTLETPVPPGCFAAAVGHRRDAGRCWPGGGGRRPFALCAAGDQEAGRADGGSAGAGLAERAVGRARGLLCDRAIGLERTGAAMGEAAFVTPHAATVGDAWGPRPHRGPLRRARGQRGAMRQQQVELEGGIGGIVLGPAQGEGCTIPRPHERIDGEEAEQVILAPGGDPGPIVECETAGSGVAVDPRAQRRAPGVHGRRRGR